MKFELGSYEPDADIVSRFSAVNLSVIAGPAAAGKDTLRNVLLEQYPETYVRIVSSTDRKPRENEVDGQDYHFVDSQTIFEKAKNKALIQVANVHNQQLSALDSSELDNIKQGQIGLSILIVQTEKQLSALNSNIKTIFLIPPSLEEMLSRLKVGRPDDQGELNRRLEAAKKEIQIALDEPKYYCLISEDQYKNADLVNSFFKDNTKNQTIDLQARETMAQMVGKL